ncbi:MAG: hypothetical protein IJ785_05910 [Bacteroidales bacterium]|nr:hypothetical protein [Bacteroidales bacterium]
MKRSITISFLAALLITACAPHPPESVTAALELYKQYADHSESLTVAYLNNYEVEGKVYNAVMFRTEDSAEWRWLQQEFSLDAYRNILPAYDENMIVTSLKLDSSIDFGDNETLRIYLDSITEKMVLKSIGKGKKVKITESKIVTISDPSALMRDSLDNGAMIIDSLPDSTKSNLLKQFGKDLFAPHFKLMDLSKTHENTGYLIGCDTEEMTLWLFFYDTPEEQLRLMEMFLNKRANN